MNQRVVLGLAAALTAFMAIVAAVSAFSILSRPKAAEAQLAPVQPATSANRSGAADASGSAAQAALSAEQAAQTALNAAPGAQLTRTPELVNFNGTVAYEVLLDQGAVYVDANSGAILSNAAAQAAPASGHFGDSERNREFEGDFGEHDD